MLRRIPVLAAVVAAVIAWPARADEDTDKKPAAGGSNPAEMFAELDGNKDGQLSTDEVPEERKRLFERLVRTADKNSDGKLSGEEFAAGLSGEDDKPKFSEQQRPERDGQRRPGPERLFKRLDANSDDKVVLDEVPEERREMFEKLLKRGDKDGDQALSRQEFAEALPDGGNAPDDKAKKGKRPEGRPDPKQFFGRLDSNGDGKVTLDEVPEQAKPRIEQLMSARDKDGDKALSLEELSALSGPGQPAKGEPGRPRPERPDRPERRPPGERGGPPAGLFGALDENRDGKLSGDEISAAADVIRKLDKDSDGSVTIEELVAAGPDRENKE